MSCDTVAKYIPEEEMIPKQIRGVIQMLIISDFISQYIVALLLSSFTVSAIFYQIFIFSPNDSP